MSKIITNPQYYTEIANAIRAKNGKSSSYLPSQMAGKILDIADVGIPCFSNFVPVQQINGATLTYCTDGYGYKTADSSGNIIYNPFANATSMKVSVRFHRTSSKNSMILIGNGYSNMYGSLPSFEINYDNISIGYAFSAKNGWDNWVTLNSTITDTWYTVQIEWDGSKVYCRSLDSTGTVIQEQSFDSNVMPAADDSSCYYVLSGFGYDTVQHVATYVRYDLNNCYYSKNGSIIWGRNSMGV